MSMVLVIAGILTTAAATYYQSTVNDAQAADVARELTAAETGLRKFVTDNYSEYANPASSITDIWGTTKFPLPIISGVVDATHPTSIELHQLGYFDGSVNGWVFTIKNDGMNGAAGPAGPVPVPSLHCQQGSGGYWTGGYVITNSGCDVFLMGQKVSPYINSDGTGNYNLLSRVVGIVGNIAGYSSASTGATSNNDGMSIRGRNNNWLMRIVNGAGIGLVSNTAGQTLSGWIYTTSYPGSSYNSFTGGWYYNPTGGGDNIWHWTVQTNATPNFEGYLGFFNTMHTSNYRGVIKNSTNIDSRIPDILNGVVVAGSTSLQKTTNIGVLATLDGLSASGVAVTGQFSSVGLITSMNTLSSSVNVVDQSCSSTTVGALSKTLTGLALSCINSPQQGMVWKLTSEISCPSGGALVTLSKPVAIPFGCNNVQIVAVGGAGGGSGGARGQDFSWGGWCSCFPNNGNGGAHGAGGAVGLSSSINMPYGQAAGKMFYVSVGSGGAGGNSNGGGAGNGSPTTIADANGVFILSALGGIGGNGVAGGNGQDAIVSPFILIYNAFANFTSPGGIGGQNGQAAGFFTAILNNITGAIQSALQIIGGLIGGALNTITGLFGQSAGFPTSGSSSGSAIEDGWTGAGGSMAAGGGGGGGGAGGVITRTNGGSGGAGGQGGAGYAIIVWTK
jgi:hypothetical protein